MIDKLLIVQCRTLAMTPQLAGAAAIAANVRAPAFAPQPESAFSLTRNRKAIMQLLIFQCRVFGMTP
jgi:hypothetical protein